jgi:serine/threonine-protein kinase
MPDHPRVDPITHDDYRRLRQVFDGALDWPTAERRAFIEQACGGDTRLIAEVERMLAADAATHAWMPRHTQGVVDAPRPAWCQVCRTPLLASHRFCPACGTPVAGDGQEGRFRAGALFANRFRIIASLGRGGMGEVYRAHDLELGQPVALKFLSALRSDERARARLRTEVRLARQIAHPSVCRVYDIGEAHGELYLSMEYVDGEDLAALLTRIGRLPVDKGIEIARKLCAGLTAAHAKGVLHRDFKPANIMIDALGEVRIMDFGLAAVASELDGHDIRSGTPAYMAPEQLAGKEATKQSDLYALGLVLYELFTGQRPFPATDPEGLQHHRESHPSTTPTTLVPELGARVERVILRCLEPDPRQRPASALEVSAALPGGDPLAEALAAGETPSPGMVAAAGSVGTITPVTAAACLAAILVGLFAIVWVSHRTTLMSLMKITKPPEVLAERARQILGQLGYSAKPVDEAYGYGGDGAIFRFLRSKAQGWDILREGRVPALFFWYRTSPAHLSSPFSVSPTDPPVTVPGMVSVATDPSGRLTRLVAVPVVSPPRRDGPDVSNDDAGPQWSELFALAGLSLDRFVRVEPDPLPSFRADRVAAWRGTWPEHPELPVRIQAAAIGAQPTYFEIRGPWREAARAPQPAAPRSAALWVFALLGGAAYVAYRNVLRGRADRRGAFRLSVLMGSMILSTCMLVAHDLNGSLPVPFAFDGGRSVIFATAVWNGVFYWILYVALEPGVRRMWPDILIGWTRLLSGRIRDPLVGREVLIGVVAGVAVAMIRHLLVLTAPFFGLTHPEPVGSSSDLQFLGFYVLSGWSPLAAPVFGLTTSVHVGLTALTFLYLLGIFLRKRWVAALACVVIIAPTLADQTIFGIVANALSFGTGVMLIFRFGLLPQVVSFFVWPLLAWASFDTSAPYAASWYEVFAMVVGVAVFGAYTALAGRSIFDVDVLESRIAAAGR